MRPATEQPAPKGILLMHCGGPGSTRDCVYYTDGPHLEGYDVFAITQRGMEGTTPSLNCDNSKLPETCPPEGCQVSDFTDCPCALLDGTPQLGEIWADLDPANESQVLNLFNKRQAWGPRCAASEKFQLRGRGGKMYNFLNYVGTQFLVYDLDEMRKAVGAENLSIYGYSYGTYVGGVYASVFSQSTGRVVLDGDMEASPRKDAQSTGDAVANDKFVAYLLNTCQESGEHALYVFVLFVYRAKASECSLKDPHVTYAKLVQRARAGKLTAPTESGMDFPLSVGLLMAYLQAESPGVGHTNEYESAPGISFADPYLEKCAVWGLDLAGYYDVSNLMHQGDAGLAAVVGDMAGYFLWPLKATPTAPMGSAIVRPLIVGNLFDSATSYSWAQDMKKAFPDGSIITWQGLGHTFPTYATDYNRQAIAHCWSHIEDYLQNGTMPINGLLCWQKEDPKVG
ncbi:Serine protease Hip1 (Hydrolase important for pathogenesis 1) (Serine hydrolase Hip1) [Durusdinium trenchii]|uniref:Serine protease Hip1 (Hydrolase important for pathogenesis 1) (Serine hydrolase Hip1) n=1 Tax=Durusdinium trenchii TaxID=1381693 RepID=A0ABP0HUT5_9DINO